MIIVLTLSALTTIAAYGSDETKFIPKNYAGSKFKDNNYKPKSYSSAQKCRDSDYRTSSKKRNFWSIFRRNKTQEHKVQRDENLVDNKGYTQQKQTPLPINRPAEKVLDNGSFKNNAGETDNKEFVPAEKPRGRNPILRPRQGIKAPSK